MACMHVQVRFASRQTSEFAEPEVIPVMGSYELRSLSRMHEGAVSAALATATGAASAAGAVSGSIVPAAAADVPVRAGCLFRCEY